MSIDSVAPAEQRMDLVPDDILTRLTTLEMKVDRCLELLGPVSEIMTSLSQLSKTKMAMANRVMPPNAMDAFRQLQDATNTSP